MKTLIPFLILCLIATCNAELRTWTAINGKEVEAEFVSNEKGIVKLKLKSGKVFEVPLNKLSKGDQEFLKAKPDRVSFEKIIERDGVTYLKSSNLPFTGICFHTENGMKIEQSVLKGKPHGKSFIWWPNGKKAEEGNYVNGQSNGLLMRWHPNGTQASKVNYKNDKKNGLWEGWHDNGNKSGKVYYKDGKPDGVGTEWYKNGLKKVQVEYKDGKEISLKFWNLEGQEVDSLEETK